MLTIHFTDEQLNSATSMEDFYKQTEVWSYICDGPYKDVSQIWMNDKQNDELRSAIQKNAHKNKNVRHISKQIAQRAAQWDWLCYSPVSDETIPRNEIRLYLKNEADVAIKELRERHASISKQG